MTGFTIGDAVKACNGAYRGTNSLSTPLGRVIIDSREIQSARNVYTRYALSIFFDMFFHGYYRRYISPYQK